MMAKVSKPNSETEVLEVMKQYCQEKGYNFSDQQLDIMAQKCYFTFESRSWKGCTYWPPLAKRWVLYNLDKQIKGIPKPSNKKSIHDIIVEQELDDEF